MNAQDWGRSVVRCGEPARLSLGFRVVLRLQVGQVLCIDSLTVRPQRFVFRRHQRQRRPRSWPARAVRRRAVPEPARPVPARLRSAPPPGYQRSATAGRRSPPTRLPAGRRAPAAPASPSRVRWFHPAKGPAAARGRTSGREASTACPASPAIGWKFDLSRTSVETGVKLTRPWSATPSIVQRSPVLSHPSQTEFMACPIPPPCRTGIWFAFRTSPVGPTITFGRPAPARALTLGTLS